MSRLKLFPFQLKLDVHEYHVGLPQLWGVIHLTLSMRFVKSGILVWRMRINKVNWITAHKHGKPKWHSFFPSFFGSWNCLTKCALENKVLNQNWWSWYHFSQEKLPQTLIPVIASTYCGKYAVPFFLSTLFRLKLQQSNYNNVTSGTLRPFFYICHEKKYIISMSATGLLKSTTKPYTHYIRGAVI